MGQKTRGIYPDGSGKWEVDKWWRGTRLRQRGFGSFEEAERWLIAQLAALREVVVHCARAKRTFEAAAAHYVSLNVDKVRLGCGAPDPQPVGQELAGRAGADVAAAGARDHHAAAGGPSTRAGADQLGRPAQAAAKTAGSLGPHGVVHPEHRGAGRRGLQPARSSRSRASTSRGGDGPG